MLQCVKIQIQEMFGIVTGGDIGVKTVETKENKENEWVWLALARCNSCFKNACQLVSACNLKSYFVLQMNLH